MHAALRLTSILHVNRLLCIWQNTFGRVFLLEGSHHNVSEYQARDLLCCLAAHEWG